MISRTEKIRIIGIVLVGVAIVGIIGSISFYFILISDKTTFNGIEEAEATYTTMFDSTAVFYDMEDHRNKISAEWNANGGMKMNGVHSYLQFVRLNDLDVLALSWWQNIDGEFVGASYECGQNMICFNHKNNTAFLLIGLLDDSLVIDEEMTLKSNMAILDIQDFDAGYDDPTKIVTVDIGGLNDFGGNILPQITLFFPTEFEDKCIFAIDYVTCEMNQALLKELQKIETD